LSINEKLTPRRIEELALALHLHPKDLVNTNNENFIKFYENVELNDGDWLTVLTHNPDFLKTPIVVKGEKACLIENPKDVLHF
jgi:arsenate reductase-like glutaredoxin family protein